MLALIVKTSSMGDVIHTLPALTDALNSLKDIQFDWIVEEDFAEIPCWHIAVRKVIKVAVRRWRKNILNLNTLKEYLNFKKLLKKVHYDYIIDAQGLIKSAFLITYIARGKKYGFNKKSSREALSSLFYHKSYFINKNQHAISKIRKLFANCLNYVINCNVIDYGINNHFSYVISKKKYLIFIYACSKNKKKWPNSHWKLLTEFASMEGYSIKLFWKKYNDFLFSKSLEEEFSNVKVLPLLTLTEIAQYLIQANAVVSIDTGLSHLAAALNVTNLTLYGPTDPNIIGCRGLNQFFLYDPNNINNIKPEQVWNFLKMIIK